MIERIPAQVQAFIDKYFSLNIQDKKVIAPYFINVGGFLKFPVFAGKGSPEEIEKVVNDMLRDRDGINSEDSIRDFMHQNSIGLDCSGFVYQVYNFWLQIELGKESLDHFLPKVNPLNLRKFISRKWKPQNSMGADEMTSEPFSNPIEVKNVQPGDLIRTRGGKHLLLVIEVEKEGELIKKVKFAHSARQYQRDGVRYGEIFFDETQNLAAAKWEDNDPSEPKNVAYEGFREVINSNGLFHPNIPIFSN